MIDVIQLAQQCQHEVPSIVVKTLVDIESSGNSLAVAVVGFDSFFQPTSLDMAERMLIALKKEGYRFSAGLMQVSMNNFSAYGLDVASVFEPCTNIRVGSAIYKKCYLQSVNKFPKLAELQHLKNAASCYFSGNFSTGYKYPRNEPYVQRFIKFYKRNSHIEAY